MKVTSTVLPQRFEKYGVVIPAEWEVNFVQFPYTDEQLIEAAKDSDVIFADSMHPVSKTVIDACKNLKMIHSEGVSFDKIDTQAAKEAGVPVVNNRAVNCAPVAEHAVGLMLAGLRHTARVDYQIKNIGYKEAKSQTLTEGIREMSSQVVGLIGMGAIGKEVVARLRPWGCVINYYDPFRLPEAVEQDMGIHYVSFDELVRTSDIISVHVPVLPSTIHMLSWEQFKVMKPTALIINISRGEIIDDDALVDALETGKIFGAALDTVAPEPMPADHVLLKMSPEAKDKLTLTPHIAGMTDDAFKRMLEWTIRDIRRLENGEELVNVVNK